jgi:hypothetical protein
MVEVHHLLVNYLLGILLSMLPVSIKWTPMLTSLPRTMQDPMELRIEQVFIGQLMRLYVLSIL